MAKQKTIIIEKKSHQRAPVQHIQPLLFDKENYIILFAGLILLAIGFLLMSGGHQPPTQFDPKIVYGFVTITLSTIVVLLGFTVVTFSIFWKRKFTKSSSDETNVKP